MTEELLAIIKAEKLTCQIGAMSSTQGVLVLLFSEFYNKNTSVLVVGQNDFKKVVDKTNTVLEKAR
jgi:hypothetical protein